MRTPRPTSESANEKTSWGEACQRVKYGDGLYQSCRDKVPEFTGFAGGRYDEEPEEDFDKQIRRSALPIPDPPKLGEVAGDEDEKISFIDDLMHGDLGKYVLYGGVAAALVWWFLIRNKTQQVAVTDSAQLPANTQSLIPTTQAA